MKLINDKNDPDLLGVVESIDEFAVVLNMIDNMNKDLRDSGFEKYQYKAEKRGMKAYIRLV